MRDLSCEQARLELSARLDGEVDGNLAVQLDEHLEGCPGCRAHEQDLASVRRVLRVQAAQEVPDLTAAIVERVSARGRRVRLRDELVTGARVAALGAAAAALVLLGVSNPFVDSPPPSTALAGEIPAAVRAAARGLDTYRASYDITERGFSDEVGVRRFVAQAWFKAPEGLRLQVRDLTTYPDDRWPVNDVDLIANARRWYLREPTSCPVAVLPHCSMPGTTEERSVVQRQPFDGTSSLPTDIVVPLETLASPDGLEVLGRTTVAGRNVLRVRLDYRQAEPLVASLQPGGLWRPFYPVDRVDIWLDDRTWFPLRFTVRAAATSERRVWAELEGLSDRPGEMLLNVRATSFAQPALSPNKFRAPRAGIVRSGGFSERDFAATSSWIKPSYLAGLRPYRAGVAQAGRTLTYSRGMTWLKVMADTRPKVTPAAIAEEVSLPDGGVGYYRPATETLKRRVDLFGEHVHVYLESNLARSELLKVAGSIGLTNERMPRVIRQGAGRSLLRLDPESAYERVPYATRPSFVPAGYSPSAALLSRSRAGDSTLTVYYRRAETDYSGEGIRITQSPSIRLLRPTAENPLALGFDHTRARWFPQRGELEWIDGKVYRSVSVPSLDLATALRIAEGLR